MKISNHITFAEAVHSNTAKRYSIKNIPNEEQTPAFRKKIKSVPIAILYKDNNKIAQWDADISFKLIVTKEEILKVIKENE